MSKAFTKEDDDAGFEPPSSARPKLPSGPFRLTRAGARRLADGADAAQRAAAERAELLDADPHPQRAALGVTVRVRTGGGEARSYRLVSPEERALLDDGCSIESPLGRALLGGRVGDICEVDAPRAHEELEIVALEPDA